MQARSETANQSTQQPLVIPARFAIDQLRPLVVGHPLQEPLVGAVMSCDFDVDKHATAEQSGALSETLLR